MAARAYIITIFFLPTLWIGIICRAHAQTNAATTTSDSTYTAADSIDHNNPKQIWRHALYITAGAGIALNGPARLTRMAEIRYDNYSISIGRVDEQSVPSTTPGVPPDGAEIERFQKRAWGFDLSRFFDLNQWLSLYGSVGYYWNSYIDLAKATDRRYYWAGNGENDRFAVGVGIEADIYTSFPGPNSILLLGLGIHSERGPVAILGFGGRFNW